jgi:hypothetical protein
MPAQAANFNDIVVTRTREPANCLTWNQETPGVVAPATTLSALRVGNGTALPRNALHRGARPFHFAPVAEQTEGSHLVNGTTQVQLLPGADPSTALKAKILSTHKVCGPPVKRCELGAIPRGGAIFTTERVRLVEDAVLKTVAPGMVSKVQILGAPPVFTRPHGAVAARPTHIRQTVERYHVGRPFYCRSGG